MEEEFEEKKRWWKTLLGLIFLIIVFVLIVIYWFGPFNSVSFGSSGNPNFNIDNEITEMQFYENMRYPDSKISYRIFNCPLQKRNDMGWAFEILENRTILNFYEVENDEEISVTCDNSVRLQEGLFIAGEGGPVEIIKSGNFNIILKGKILLLRDSDCPTPNIATHELLHALGFTHSTNKNNIMYNFSNCQQTIGEDIPTLIDKIYSIESLPDLVLENVSALMHGQYIDFNVSIRNNGFRDAEKSTIEFYVDNKHIKSFDVNELNIGTGIAINTTNVQVFDFNIEKIKFFLNYSFSELDKKNNEIELKISN